MAKATLSCNDSPKLREISKMIDTLNYKTDRYSILSDIFEAGAIGISNQVDLRPKVWKDREERYKTIMQKYDEKDRQLLVKIFGKLFDLLSNMIEYGFDDYLGKLYMMSGTSNNKTGQFFTPYSVSKVSAQCAISKEIVKKKIEDDEIITINEPAVGSGGMMIASLDVLWNDYGFNYAHNCFIDCGDIDTRCVHMAYVQLSLSGVPAIVRHMDALTMQQWNEWHTPAFCMQFTRFEKFLR